MNDSWRLATITPRDLTLSNISPLVKNSNPMICIPSYRDLHTGQLRCPSIICILISYPSDVAISVAILAANLLNPCSKNPFGWFSSGKCAPRMTRFNSFFASNVPFDGQLADA